LARALNRAAGQAACYRGGLVAVADTGLVDLLGITIEQLDATCATGTDRASLLATATRDRFRTDFGLAVTARSRAADTEADSDAPLASIALAHAAGVDARELNLAGDPAIASVRLAKSALDLLRLHLLREIRRAGTK
jgi:nicotinamide mononucleotide (NMN) deamidase PncC